MISTWANLVNKQNYSPVTRGDCLVVTATNDAYSQGAAGMIKSFYSRSELDPDFIVLGKNLSIANKIKLEALPSTRVKSLIDHNAKDHWCTWILELFWLDELTCYDYVFYVDTDIMVRKSLTRFIDDFDDFLRSSPAEDSLAVCVVDHKRVWHKEWFFRKKHNFNAGFIVFKKSFFKSVTFKDLREQILMRQPNNDEKFLRTFFRHKNLVYAPTKFNGRIIWLNEVAVDEDEVFVVHFVGQENKPWLRKVTRWEIEWHKIFNMSI